MSQLDDNAYYIRRIAEELERSDRAPNENVAAVHRELARRYSKLVAQMGARKPRFTRFHGASEQLAA